MDIPDKIPSDPALPYFRNGSHYSPELCKSLVDFFDKPRKQILPNGDTISLDMPLLGDWAHMVGVGLSTVYKWRDTYPEFAEAYEIARQLAEGFLITNSLNGDYNGSFAALLAKNKFGWAEKQELDISAQLAEHVQGIASKYLSDSAPPQPAERPQLEITKNGREKHG